MASRRQLLQELDKLEPPIRNRYLEAVREAVGAVSIQEVESLLRTGDLEGVLAATALTSGALADVNEAVRDAYIAGGKLEARQARINFDVRNQRAERWLSEQSSRFVTQINEGQREAIRQTVETGTRIGNGPRQTALDIVGRVDRTGRRKGGIVGLADNQAGYVANAREQLRSGDPEQMRAYLTRARRDRRFDGMVRRAIENERPVSRRDMERITARYSDRLLQLRGETIARTEGLQGFSAARDEAWSQAIDEGVVQEQNVTKIWRTAGADGRRRDSHIAMQGQTVAKSQPFTTGAGFQLMHPGDTGLGAPASEIVACRCTAEYRADFIAEAQ